MVKNNHTLFRNLLNLDEISRIENMLNQYSKNKNRELEFSFLGLNYPNYIRIIEHYIDLIDEKNITSEYYLDISILLADGNTYRISLFDEEFINNFLERYANAGKFRIQKYLLDLNPSDSIEIIYKDRGSADRLYIEDLGMVVKSTTETPFDKSKPKLTGNEKILYRYKERTSFKLSDSIRLDITNAKETTELARLQFQHSKYEIEAEVTSRKIGLDDLFEQINEILKVVQNTIVPIGKKEAHAVIQEYRNLLDIKHGHHLESRNVISMEIQHLVNNVPNKYGITDKADGDRFFLFVLPNGIYMISTNLDVKKINLKSPNEKFYHTLLDGEYVNNEFGKFYLGFDVIYSQGKDYRYDKENILPERVNILNKIIDECFGNYIVFPDYIDKHSEMEIDVIRKYYKSELEKYWKKFRDLLKKQNGIFVTRKIYFIPYGFDPAEVFVYADMVWKLYVYDELPPYKLDGIIYTPISTPYMIKAKPHEYDIVPMEYKWKKPSQNSIDFYIRFIKDSYGNETIFYDNSVKNDVGNAYKICKLFVGSIEHNFEKPIPFVINGIEQTANIYLVDNEARDALDKIIEDSTVVEFIFDSTKIGIDNSYKWIPIRTRYDKTESVIRYKKRYGNNLNIAERIWRSIMNPITEENIASLGNPDTYQREMDRMKQIMIKYSQQPTIYYQIKTSDASNMRDYHNWIKTNLISTYAKNASSVLDIGAGRGGDLIKYINAKVEQYVGIDIDNNSLYTINDSAYKRYLGLKQSKKNVPPMFFINADARGILDVKAQESIFPNMSEKNKELIRTHLSGKKKYKVLSSQFSLHYFISDELSWSNFTKNVNDHLENNGYLLITCFDGDIIREKLKNKQKMTITYTDRNGNKKTFFEIIKIYKDDDTNKIGLAIDVYNSLISNPDKYIREYLVLPDFLEKSLKKNVGLELVETDTFYNLFSLYKNYFMDDSIADFVKDEMSTKRYNSIKELYQMMDPNNRDLFTGEQIDSVMANFKISILNRYYVFKKSKSIDLTEPSRVVGINHRINIGKVLTPYFDKNSIIIDPGRKTNKINKLYHAIRKTYPDIQPMVYLIRHTIPEDGFENEIYRRNKLEFSKVKKGNSSKILLIYKSPEKIFYPVYRQTNAGNKYLFDGKQVAEEMDMMVALSNGLNK